MKHYFSEYQDSELKLKKIKARLRGNSFEFFSGSGVFSKDKVDKGSELLINSCIIKKKWRVLDLGCGYGAIGIAIGKSFPTTKIVMVDVNKRAIKLAKMNLKLNNIDNAKVMGSNLFERISDKFNTIIINPPQKAGKEICFKIIDESKNYLEKNGLEKKEDIVEKQENLEEKKEEVKEESSEDLEKQDLEEKKEVISEEIKKEEAKEEQEVKQEPEVKEEAPEVEVEVEGMETKKEEVTEEESKEEKDEISIDFSKIKNFFKKKKKPEVEVKKEEPEKEEKVEVKKEEPKKEEIEIRKEEPKKERKPFSFNEFYNKNFKKLIILPFSLLVLSIILIIFQAASTGEFINKDVSLKGGITITIPLEKQVDIINLENSLGSDFSDNDLSVRSLKKGGQQIGLIVSADIDGTKKEEVDALLDSTGKHLNIDLSKIDYTTEVVGSSLGASFFREIIKVLIIAFLFMGFVVFIYFRKLVPSGAIIVAAFSDIIVTLAIVNLLGMKLSTAGIAAF